MKKVICLFILLNLISCSSDDERRIEINTYNLPADGAGFFYEKENLIIAVHVEDEKGSSITYTAADAVCPINHNEQGLSCKLSVEHLQDVRPAFMSSVYVCEGCKARFNMFTGGGSYNYIKYYLKIYKVEPGKKGSGIMYVWK